MHVVTAVEAGANVVERGADMHRGEAVLMPGTRIGAPQVGVLAALGVTDVDVYRRPVVAVFSSGDEIVPASTQPRPGQVRDSNRYAIAASLRAMGAQPIHYPKVADEAEAFERELSIALQCCDAVAMSGGSSVGERDRLPAAVAALGTPGIVVHGLRVKPGKPSLLGAIGDKPILGLPGNPTSALMMLEAVFAPIVGALVGARVPTATTTARLAEAARSREGWTWYVPVALRDDGGTPQASFYEAQWAKGTTVSATGDVFAFKLPAVDPAIPTPVEGGGEFVTAFSSDPATQAVQNYLSSPQWADSRIKVAPGWVSANEKVDQSLYTDPIDQLSAKYLADPNATFAFDASDAMPAWSARARSGSPWSTGSAARARRSRLSPSRSMRPGPAADLNRRVTSASNGGGPRAHMPRTASAGQAAGPWRSGRPRIGAFL